MFNIKYYIIIKLIKVAQIFVEQKSFLESVVQYYQSI